jgi:O-succinylbenzoic acid--CoA ligase
VARELLVVDVTDPKALIQPLTEALDGSGPAVFPVLGSGPPDCPAQVDDDVVLVVETSGSTATPKRVWHTRDSLLAAANQSQHALGEPGVWWLALPAHYIAGVMVMVRAIVSRGELVVKAPEQNVAEGLIAFDCEAKTLSRDLPRYTSLVPKQLADLLDAAEDHSEAREALAGFARILVGGQRVPEALVSRAAALGVTVTKTYGSAETAGGCVWDGKPLRDTGVDVVDDRIALSGPMVAGGYVDNVELTNEHFIERGGIRWFVTDDTGHIDDGVLNVTGRADRVIISGGVKVNLDEVEAFLHEAHPDISLATAKCADATWGEAITVVADKPLGYEAVKESVSSQFGPAARVIHIITVESFPFLASGKIDRHAISHLVASLED